MLGTEKIKLECILEPLLCAPCAAVSNLMCHKCNLWVLFALKYMFLVQSLECKNLQCLLEEVQNNSLKAETHDLLLTHPSTVIFLIMTFIIFLSKTVSYSKDKFKQSSCYCGLCVFHSIFIIQCNFYWVFNKYGP